MKISIIRKEKDEKFYTRTELATIYENIISGKYADEVNKVKEDFPLTFLLEFTRPSVSVLSLLYLNNAYNSSLYYTSTCAILYIY